jgi:hypothetical protein
MLGQGKEFCPIILLKRAVVAQINLQNLVDALGLPI